MHLRMLFAAAAAAAALVVASASRGNETDQYTLPVGAKFADMGPYFTAMHHGLLEEAVERLNSKIDSALRNPDQWERERDLARLHDPQTVADVVRYRLPPGFIDTMVMESVLTSAAAREAYPGEITAYKRLDWIYLFAHLPVDPRNVPLLFQSSTVKVYGVYLGTDKIAHFHDLGHIYYTNYIGRVRRGATVEEAKHAVAREFSRGLISEGWIIGTIASGVASNADLASNYVGMKFYQNLTEPVMLKGRLQPPMLVRAGPYWRLNQHVRPESDFFSVFISDHFNEALNPNLYEWGLRRSIAGRLRRDADNIVAFYTDGDGRPRNGAYFDALARELSTYYGEEYGYLGELGTNILTLGNTCFAELEVRAQRDGQRSPAEPVPGEPLRPAAIAWVSGRALGEGQREYLVGANGGRTPWVSGYRRGERVVRRTGDWVSGEPLAGMLSGDDRTESGARDAGGAIAGAAERTSER